MSSDFSFIINKGYQLLKNRKDCGVTTFETLEELLWYVQDYYNSKFHDVTVSNIFVDWTVETCIPKPNGSVYHKISLFNQQLRDWIEDRNKCVTKHLTFEEAFVIIERRYDRANKHSRMRNTIYNRYMNIPEHQSKNKR